MVSNEVLKKYKAERERNPFGRALDALLSAKHTPAKSKWEQTTSGAHVRAGADYCWEREIEGFTVKLWVSDESCFPMPDKHGDTDFGRYIDEIKYEDYEWDGEWARPAELAEFLTDEPRRRLIRLPYKAIRYQHPGWMRSGQSDEGYFIPKEIDEQYAYYRRQGASRSVALDLTREWVEEMNSLLFCSPLTYSVVNIEAWKEDIELASAAMGTDYFDNQEGNEYVFEMVEEYGMVDDVLEEARLAIEKLTAAA